MKPGLQKLIVRCVCEVKCHKVTFSRCFLLFSPSSSQAYCGLNTFYKHFTVRDDQSWSILNIKWPSKVSEQKWVNWRTENWISYLPQHEDEEEDGWNLIKCLVELRLQGVTNISVCVTKPAPAHLTFEKDWHQSSDKCKQKPGHDWSWCSCCCSCRWWWW